MKHYDPVTGKVTDPLADWIQKKGGKSIPPSDAPRVIEPECVHSPDGKHSPDLGSIRYSEAAVADMLKECIMDISCRHCGRSGAFRVDLQTEIDW